MGSSVKGYVTNNRANTCLGVLKASLLLLLDTSNLAPRPTVLQISTVPQMTWSMINYGPRVWAGGRRDGGGKSLELSTLTPPGLKDIKKVEMYTKWQKILPPYAQDITCPYPREKVMKKTSEERRQKHTKKKAAAASSDKKATAAESTPHKSYCLRYNPCSCIS